MQIETVRVYSAAFDAETHFAPEVGQPLSDVPKEQASVWGVKTLTLNDALALRIGAGVRYVGETLSISGAGRVGITRKPDLDVRS